MSISVKNLSKIYGQQKAVNDISFTVGKGEIVGFLGPNGAGKSTTMKMITGYLKADQGQVEVCGLPVSENSIETKKHIGYLPEANPLYFDMYVKEYLNFIAGIHQVAHAKERMASVIKTVGLGPEANKKIGQLSKGYKQRVGLAAAMVHNPTVLILDEPTSGLDPNQIIDIRNVIKNLAADKTILFSSHIMQEVEAICSRVIIINKGTIVANDTIANLQKLHESRQAVLVEFLGPADIEALKKLSSVAEVLQKNTHTFLLQTTNADLVKKLLLQWSIDNHVDIVSLQTAEQSLEDVFRELTIKNEG